MLDLKHTFNLSQATLIKTMHCIKSRRLLEEVSAISIINLIAQRLGFYQISPYLANIIQHENNINIENGWKSF